MTNALAPTSGPSATQRPAPDALVLATRTLRPGIDPAALSRFGDDRWTLTHALHEAHAKATCLQMTTVPAAFRDSVKHATWLLINHDPDEGVALHASASRPAIRTIVSIVRYLTRFTEWLTVRGITRFADVTPADLDRYADDVRGSAVSHGLREDLLAAAFRLWTMRALLPETDRLPQAPPWGGERIRDILGRGRDYGENRTPRIHPDTMTPLLSWCLRFVEDFAVDIIAAFDEYKHLCNRSPQRRIRTRESKPERQQGRNVISDRLVTVVDRYRAAGRGLPGRRGDDGTLTINTYHLSRLVEGHVSLASGRGRHREILTTCGLPIDDDCYLFAPVTARLNGTPWRDRPITWDEAPVLARHLSTACYVIIAYLSGQRPGETLNLRRGCIDHDHSTGLTFLRGKHFKGARDASGNHLAEGTLRPDPWVVVASVATAVAVLERLHDGDLLFPNTLEINGRAETPLQTRKGQARNDQLIAKDIGALCNWINDYCHRTGRDEHIPADPNHASLHPSRLRRTLAWFIARKPRDLVAAAIQYGHLTVTMTLGYSGTYASGFPDDLAFEQWLAKLDTMAEAHDRLEHGEHISGPAAGTYRHRIQSATRFAGRVLRTNREAATLLADPDLQIHPGKGMTCVLDPHRAACRLTRDERGHRHTPDLDNCRPTCANIARADRDVTELRDRAQHLQTLVDDPLAPPIRAEREHRELARLTEIITRHDRGRA